MLDTLAVANYRSLRRLVVPLRRITVVTGANGSGKSSLYRALRLLADAARNGAVNALAAEGGLASTMWAGPGRTGPVSLKLGFAGTDFGYALDLGMPVPGRTAFNIDPEIKSEALWAGPVLRPATLLVDRGGPAARIRDADGRWQQVGRTLQPFDSVFSELADPHAAPELMALRDRMRSWRFYDHVRTDSAAPARISRIGTRTPVLGHDGADLAAAWQTIAEVGDADALAAAVDAAFPGSAVVVAVEGGRFELRLSQPGMARPLGAAELSDGTLRYLLWVAALLSPRPAELTVLNEPEASLHPDLLPALAALIARAAEATQVVVVTHSATLVSALAGLGDDGDDAVGLLRLVKTDGETAVENQGLLDRPPWHWPERS